MSKNTNESLRQNLSSDKETIQVLGAGLFLLLVGTLVTLFLDTTPNTWLFYLDIRYWSVYTSAFLWVATIWVIAESTDLAEDYLPPIRVVAAIGLLLVIIFALRSSFGNTSPTSVWSLLWSNFLIVAVVCCAIRSLFLLYNYWYEGKESIDFEEAQWFWGWSGILTMAAGTIGIMSMIPAKVLTPESVVTSESLLASCYHGLHELARSGQGSLALRAFGCLIMAAFIGFVYTAGKWMLIFTSRRDWRKIVAIGDDSESINITNYLPHIKICAVVSVLLVIIFVLWRFFNATDFSLPHHPLWVYVVFAIAVFCAVRSLWLLYNYWYEGEESIDFEEAQWFWGWSGIFIVVVSVVEMMYIIPTKVLTPEGVASSESLSLLASCYDALQGLIQYGQGSGGLRALALLVFIVSIAFVYIAGRWMLIFASRRIWGE